MLCFGLMRPYKGIDVLLEAWRGITRPSCGSWGCRGWTSPRCARGAPANVRFVPRFIADDELPAYFQRADLVVLPYREIDQSGVLFTALAFGKPLLLSDVGGLPRDRRDRRRADRSRRATRRAARGAARSCSAIPAALAAMAGGTATAAAGPYSWDAIGQARRSALYESLAARESRR